MRITLYHNPRCSKSRAVLSLLTERELDVEIIEYLKTPLDSLTLNKVLEKLGGSPRQLLRKNEAEYKELNLGQANREQLIGAIAKYPNLMQRPIIVSGDRAVIGRPPENVLTIL